MIDESNDESQLYADENLNNHDFRENIENLNKNKIKFIDPNFGYLALLFLLLPTIMLIVRFNDYNNSFELISKVIILLHECIFGATLILINIFGLHITLFIQNSTAFYTLFVGKVVVGFYFSYCSILNCKFDPKKGFWNFFSCFLGAIFMLVDCTLVFISKINVKKK